MNNSSSLAGGKFWEEPGGGVKEYRLQLQLNFGRSHWNKSRIARVKLQFDASFTIGRGGAQVESIGWCEMLGISLCREDEIKTYLIMGCCTVHNIILRWWDWSWSECFIYPVTNFWLSGAGGGFEEKFVVWKRRFDFQWCGQNYIEWISETWI